jgi:hypothetical protein
MTPRDKAIEADLRTKANAAYSRSVERSRNSPDGMRDTAQGLRDRARNMSDAGDRATMLHLASEYERRASELAERLRARTGN